MTRPAIWVILAGVALLWPGRVSGPLDGIPLDTAIDVVALGLLLPLVCWWNPRFLTSRLAHACVVGILAAKALAALALVPDGWCATVYPSRPYVRDQTGVPHSWDVRADWRDANPACAAIMTRGYRRLEEFPVWFFNLPAADGTLPQDVDIPPDATTRLVVSGSLTAPRRGIFRLDTTPGVAAATTIDGRAGPAEGVSLDPGSHRIVIDATLTGDRWRLLPMWNDASVFDATVVTTSPPSRADLLIRPLVRWTTTALAALLLGAWAASTLRPIADPWTVGWIAAACAALACDALYVSQYRWHYAVAVFAWPVRAPAAIVWTPRAWPRRLPVATLAIVPTTVAAGVALFALRTWYYTGTFSVFKGTQASLLSVWQPGMALTAGLRAAAVSVAMVLSTTDPPRLHMGALPLFVAPTLAVAALARIRPFDRLPLPLVLFALSSLAGALVARGTAYTGRFSIHVIGAMTAVLACALAQAWTAASKAARPKTERATAA